MSRKVNIFNVLGAAPGCADPDVIAYFAKAEFSEANLASYLAARGLTYDELKDIVCDFIQGLKTDGVYGSIDALYINVGDTATQKKFNFIDPQDLDSSFRLQFNGGWTFDDIGFSGNNINAYAQTFWIPLINGTSSSAYFGHYSNSTPIGNKIHGVFQSIGGTSRMWNNIGASTATFQIALNSIISYTGTRIGFFQSRRSLASGANANVSYRDGVSLGSTTGTFTPPTIEFYFGAVNNNGSPGFYNDNVISLGILSGAAFSDADCVNIDARVQTYLTALGVI